MQTAPWLIIYNLKKWLNIYLFFHWLLIKITLKKNPQSFDDFLGSLNFLTVFFLIGSGLIYLISFFFKNDENIGIISHYLQKLETVFFIRNQPLQLEIKERTNTNEYFMEACSAVVRLFRDRRLRVTQRGGQSCEIRFIKVRSGVKFWKGSSAISFLLSQQLRPIESNIDMEVSVATHNYGN